MRPHFPSAESQTASETGRWFPCCPPLCDDSGVSHSSLACWLHDPAVSVATGKRLCVFSSPWYFAVLSAACLAAAPRSAAVQFRWYSVRVSGTVSDVPSHQFPLGLGYKSCYVWAFAITSEEACWFLIIISAVQMVFFSLRIKSNSYRRSQKSPVVSTC